MDVLFSSQTSRNLLNAPKKKKEIQSNEISAQLLISSPVQHDPELVTDDSKLLKQRLEPLCTNYSPRYLRVDNYLSEFDTKAKQLFARLNIGITGQYEQINQLKYEVKNEDIYLNNDFVKAINIVLNGKKIQSVDDAISVILHHIFPITYIEWDLNISNNAIKTYTIEKGTKQKLEKNVGTIYIRLVPGNKSNKITNLSVNNVNIYQDGIVNYTIQVNTTDLTDKLELDTSLFKNYSIKLITDDNVIIEKTVQVGINIVKQQYYFPGIYDIYNENDLPEKVKNTSNTCVFNLGSDKKWISVFAPINVTKVETATSVDGVNWGNFFITTGYYKIPVIYTPENGDSQLYYRITLDTKQSSYVKIKVT